MLIHSYSCAFSALHLGRGRVVHAQTATLSSKEAEIVIVTCQQGYECDSAAYKWDLQGKVVLLRKISCRFEAPILPTGFDNDTKI